MDTDAPKEEPPKPKTRKVRKQVRKGDLPIVSAVQSLDPQTKALWMEKEGQMVAEDKLVAETEEKKNELETYIYELRNKLDDQYAEFATDEEKAKIREKCDATEVCTLLLLSSFFDHCILTAPRNGSTTRATTPLRPCTSPSSRRSARWPAPSCSATSKRWRRSGAPCRPGSRPSAPPRRLPRRRRPARRPRRRLSRRPRPPLPTPMLPPMALRTRRCLMRRLLVRARRVPSSRVRRSSSSSSKWLVGWGFNGGHRDKKEREMNINGKETEMI